MTSFIALIRGINVGGNSKVSMTELKACFERVGFSNVSTYINSGNVLFSSEETDETALVSICETLLDESFGVTTRVAVISVAEFRDALAYAPNWWGHDAESKHNALFVIAPANAEEIMQGVGAAKPEYEKVASYKNVIFWSAPLKTFSRTRWSKIVSTAAYGDITIRNANTVRKLRTLTD